jgi:hypothetical protein
MERVSKFARGLRMYGAQWLISHDVVAESHMEFDTRRLDLRGACKLRDGRNLAIIDGRELSCMDRQQRRAVTGLGWHAQSPLRFANFLEFCPGPAVVETLTGYSFALPSGAAPDNSRSAPDKAMARARKS